MNNGIMVVANNNKNNNNINNSSTSNSGNSCKNSSTTLTSILVKNDTSLEEEEDNYYNNDYYYNHNQYSYNHLNNSSTSDIIKKNTDNNNNNNNNNNNEYSILYLPVEIIFHIFDIQLTNKISNNHIKNNNQHSSSASFKSSILNCIQNFSMTCKYFYFLFQDEGFWLKSYKSFFSFYSMVDLDKKCLSLENNNNSLSNSNNTIGNITTLQDNNNNNNISWRKRFINRHHPWDYDNIKCKKEIVGYHNLGITSLEVDDNYLYSGSHDTNINIYDIEDLKLVSTLSGHKYTIWALKSDGKKYLYSGSNDQTLRVWDLKRNICKSVIKDTNKIFSIALSDKLLFSTSGNDIKVYDKKDLQQLSLLSGHTGGVNKIFVSDHKLFSGSSDRSVKVWDLHKMSCLTTKSDDTTSKVLSMTMIDENTLATGSQNCQIKIWDLRCDLPVQCLTNVHKWDVWQLEMCGGYLFSGSFDHSIKIWDPRNFQNLKSIHGHRSYIHALTSSSFHLFSGSADKHIRVWSDK